MDFVVNTLTLTVRFAVTLMIASMGEMFNQKAGIFNLGCEGIMSVGAFLGMLIPFTMVGAGQAPGYVNILGLLVATVCGMLLGLLFGVIVISFRAPQGIAGIGMQMFGVGLAGTFFRSYIGGTQSITGISSMEIGNGLPPAEERTHFAMWCMMSTPLMIGCDLTKIPQATLDLLKNRELIALDQDQACLQAYVVKEVKNEKGALLGEVWVKDLGSASSNEKAIAFLNRSDSPLRLSVDPETAGLSGKILSLRDLWAHEDLPAATPLSFEVPPHETVVLRAKSEKAGTTVDLNASRAYREPKPLTPISKEEARELLKKGALLLDARTREEYQKGHLQGALCTPFTEIYSHIAETVPTKDTVCVAYCAKGLRSAQVKYTMDHMGYTQVYFVGGIGEDAIGADKSL